MTLEAEATTEKATSPSGVSEAISMFQQSQDQAAAAAKQTEADAAAKKETAETKPAEGAPAPEGGDAGKPEGKSPELSLKLVNEKGEPTPFVFKADGKDITEADLAKIRQYVEIGYHGSQRLEALNAKEKLLNDQLAVIEMIDRAQKEGRLVIKEEGAKPEPEKTEDADDDVYTDPQVKELKERVKKTEEEVKKTAGLFIKESIDKAYQDLKGQIEAKKTEFPAAREPEVWKLLELQDEKTGKPLHDVASAMKAAHEKETEYLMAAPLPDKRRQQIITDYLEEKRKAEEAPVGAPAGAAPGQAGQAAGDEKKPISGVTDAIERFKREYQGGASSKF